MNSLNWGYYGQSDDDRHHAERRRKRKRAESNFGYDPNEMSGEVALAFGTSDSQIQFLSLDGKIIGTLQGAHTLGVRDFKFEDLGKSGKGWSVGGDGKIMQWDLHEGKCIKSDFFLTLILTTSS